MGRELLSAESISHRSADLAEAWSVSSEALKRKIAFPSFMYAVKFVREMAPEAEKLDHHPDLLLSWRNVELTLSTHSAGGVTDLDFTLAAALDPIIAKLGGA
jgi:4a-hydroxytetrahydrobiopterin dehydratase